MASLSSSSELLNEEIEIQSLKNSFLNNTAKKSNYGSLRKDTQQTTVFIVNYKHKLKPGETLQGISLKYNVPVCIKINKFKINDFDLNLTIKGLIVF